MVRRVFENLSLGTLSAVPEFFQFMNEVGKMTVICLHGTGSHADEGWISEASDECLATWVKLGVYFFLLRCIKTSC